MTLQETEPRIRPVERRPTILSTEGGTDQSEKGLSDINNIVAAALDNSQQPVLTRGEPFYADLTTSEDYHASLNRLMAAQSRFQTLPSRVRAAADNDPGQLLAMLATEEGTNALIEAGLDLRDPNPPEPVRETPTPAVETPAETPEPPA